MRTVKIMIALLLGVTVVAGCGKKKEKQILALQSEKEILQAEYQKKDSLLNELFFSMNAIEKNLADITMREKLITETPVDEKRSDMDVREKIMDEIVMINYIMEENKKRIEVLKGQLKKSDLKAASLQENINMLTKRLEEKEAELAVLKEQLVKLNFKIEELNITVDTLRDDLMAQSHIISQQDMLIGEMNTVWYVTGTRKELTEKGIIEKAGGMLSGKMKMSDKINPDHFTTADMRNLDKISFTADKAELVTIHAEGAYRLLETEEGINGLEVLDAKEFWKSSRFLVIITK